MNPGVRAWSRLQARIGISPVSVEEIFFGLAWKPRPGMTRRLEAILEEGTIELPLTNAISRRAGDLRGSFRRRGVQRSAADMLIAATALVHDLTLVTRNVRDFEGCGVRIVNPFR